MAIAERPSRKRKTFGKRQQYGMRVMPWRFKVYGNDTGRTIVIGKTVPAPKHAKRLVREGIFFVSLGPKIGSKGVVRVSFLDESDGKKALIPTVYVPKEHRGRGYASQMVDKALGLARQEGAKTAYINIEDVPSSPMRSILEKRGFTMYSERSGILHYSKDLHER